MNDNQGSLWRKWDLHVHTPASLEQHYGGDRDEVWDMYLNDLENLPSEFSVIGINDYLFLDGYRRVLKAKDSGRLSNLDLILPVIELRMARFGGSRSNLSRVNLHVIFSNELSPDTIEDQFLSGLNRDYKLSPEHQHLQWKARITRQSLTDLGQMIIDSVPEDQRQHYGSPLTEGFNNLNYEPEPLIDSLKQNTYLRNNYLLAVGKTEWADIKWNDQSIADKKSLINNVHLVFSAGESSKKVKNAQKALADAEVNSRLLDCSDAHDFSDSSNKDRIGNCETWLKADPTFEGLKQALREYEERVALEVPDQIIALKARPDSYIRRACISRTGNASCTETWFDNTLTLNPGLIAIIGNKGSGKSALADIIALAGNSETEGWAFLKPERFGKLPENKADSFCVEIEWENGRTVSRKLSEINSRRGTEEVKYIPQNYFERLCNDLQTGEKLFQEEIEEVLFNHVPEGQRFGKDSFQSLLQLRTRDVDEGIRNLLSNLQKVNNRVAELEDATSEAKKLELKQEFSRIQTRIQTLREQKPEQPDVEHKDDENLQLKAELESARDEAKNLQEEFKARKEEKHALNKKKLNINHIRSRLKGLRDEFQQLLRELGESAEGLDISISNIAELKIDFNALDTAERRVQATLARIEQELSEGDNSLPHRLRDQKEKVENLTQKLHGPQRKLAQYESELEAWETELSKRKGNLESPGTLLYVQEKLRQLEEDLPTTIETFKDKRLSLCHQIFLKKKELCRIREELLAPAEEFLRAHKMETEFSQLNFAVKIQLGELQSRFFDMVSHGARGTFYGTAPGTERFAEIIADVNFEDWDSVKKLVQELESSLRYDRRAGQAAKNDIDSQLKRGYSSNELFDYLFGLTYLEPRYDLRLDGKPIESLSPGEKGAVLLMFYLLVDSRTYPLIIDQPEENLDNQSVYQLLVQCIRAAKSRRQILMVTHNPNLAVVCDAEQIIWAEIDKADNFRVSYTTGAIENPSINQALVNILEGTAPAFQNRSAKYIGLATPDLI